MNPIRHEFSTPATAAAAYDAVATSAGIKGWWAKAGLVSEKVGGTTELRFDKDGQIVVMKFRVDALEPGRMVRWICTENANPVWIGSTLTWTVEDAGASRTVRFVHEGFPQGRSALRHDRRRLEAFQRKSRSLSRRPWRDAVQLTDR